MSRKIIVISMFLMAVGVVGVVVFFLSFSAGSVENSDRAMLISADVEPPSGVAMTAPPADNSDADGDGVGELAPLVRQTQVQQQQIQEQRQLTNDLLEEVNAMRGLLIEKRFESLDKLAKRRGWHRNRRIPKKGNRWWEEYREWDFLKDNLEEVKKPPEPEPKPKLEKLKKSLKKTKAAAKPIQAAKKQYKPDWLVE